MGRWWREGKVGLESLAGWSSRALLGTRRHGSDLSTTNPLLCTLCDAGQACKELWVEASLLNVHPPIHPSSQCKGVHCHLSVQCMVGAFVRVAAGHYTNRRGDTLGASPETRERETGKKNFWDESTRCQSTVHKTKPVYDGWFFVYNSLSDKEEVQGSTIKRAFTTCSDTIWTLSV